MNAYKCHIAPDDYRSTYYESTVVIASTLRKAVERFEQENPLKCLKSVDVIATDVILDEDRYVAIIPQTQNHLK